MAFDSPIDIPFEVSLDHTKKLTRRVNRLNEEIAVLEANLSIALDNIKELRREVRECKLQRQSSDAELESSEGNS